MFNRDDIKFDGLLPESVRPHRDEASAAPFAAAVGALRRATYQAEGPCVIDTPLPTFNQGPTNTCVANATARALMLLMPRDRVIVPARLGIYYVSCAYTGQQGQDHGTYIHNAFRAIAEEGVCPEDDWPFLVGNIPRQPPVRSFRVSNEYRIQTWYRVGDDDRLDECESALRSGHPVVFGTMVGQELVDYQGGHDGDGVLIGPTRRPLGLHAMVLTGVRTVAGQRQWRVDNSWSTLHGIHGRFWADDAFMTDRYTTDLFVPTQCPALA